MNLHIYIYIYYFQCSWRYILYPHVGQRSRKQKQNWMKKRELLLVRRYLLKNKVERVEIKDEESEKLIFVIQGRNTDTHYVRINYPGS